MSGKSVSEQHTMKVKTLTFKGAKLIKKILEKENKQQ